MTKQINPKRVACFALFIFLSALFFVQRSEAQSGPNTILKEAWSNTERVGSYEFTTELTETRAPSPQITAVGRGLQVSTLLVDGIADRQAQQLELTIWDDPSRVHDTATAYDIRIDGLKAEGRVHNGEWQAVDDISGAFAPAGDAAIFLSAAQDVRLLGADSAESPQHGTVHYERYAFTLNSDQYADQMNSMVQAQLHEQGQLPHGISVTAGEQFRDMFAEGEAWIDSNGLPLRLTIEMQFPQERNGERVRVNIKTDFVSYNDEAAVGRIQLATNFSGWLAQTGSGLTVILTDALPTLSLSAGLFVLFVAAVGLQKFRPKLFHTSFATMLSAQMAFAPLTVFADAYQMDQFLDRFPHARVDELDENEAALAQIAELQSAEIDQWNQPFSARQQQHDQVASVLNQSVQRAPTNDPDSDKDGMSDKDELSHCANPNVAYSHPDNADYPSCSDPNDDDTDNDGLKDGEEYIYLGTFPNVKDSDGDGIWDHAEVRGFFDSAADVGDEDKRRFSNPLVADTDGDGRIDGVECPEMEDKAWTPTMVCQNTDSFGNADVLEIDDDGDKVPSKIDLSPLHSLTPNSGQFDRSDSLELTLQNMTKEKPILVDVQLRPILPEQLSFALNYLDWPTGDTAGQVQRHVDSTFASIDPSTPANSPAANGDMRVTPMLEVTLPADTKELPRTAPEITFDLSDAGRIMGEFNFIAIPNSTFVSIPRIAGSSGVMTVRQGDCANGGTLVYSSSISDGFTDTIGVTTLGDIANGQHTLSLQAAGNTFCQAIPSLVEGASSVDMLIQTSGQSIGKATVAGNTNSVLSFPELNGTYTVQVHNATCAGRLASNLLETAANTSQGDSFTIFNQGAVVTANGTHSLTLLDGDETVSCTRIDNIINGSSNEMIDTTSLEAYQISVHEGENNEIVAMLPVSLVTDEVTGERVAFSGRMFFERASDSTGDLSADFNLIWVISALTDACPDGDCSKGIINQPQIVQTYRNEGWQVTGLRVEEELRYDVAVVLEDPATDVVLEGMSGPDVANRSLESDDNLWALVRGLQATFLPGRDVNGNGVRDYAVAFFESYFDGPSTETTRFGIRNDALLVETYELGQQANIGDLLNTHIPQILDDNFNSGICTNGVCDVPDIAGNPKTTVQPTLLFASESENRAIDLDELTDSSPQVATSDNTVTVNFDSNEIKPVTLAALSWKPFQYANGEWQAASVEDYTNRMKGILRQSAEFFASTEEEEFGVEGRLLMAEAAYLTYYLGRANAVKYEDQLAWNFNPSDGLSPSQLTVLMNTVKGRATGIGGMVDGFVKEAAAQVDFELALKTKMQASGSPQQLIDSLDFGVTNGIGRGVRGRGTEINRNFQQRAAKVTSGDTTSRLKGAGGMAVMGALMFNGVASSYFSPYSKDSTVRGVGLTMRSISLASEVYSSVQIYQAFSAFKVNNPTKGIGAFSKTLSATRAAKIMGVVGVVIAVGFSVGAFIATVVSAELSFFGLAFNDLLANTVAAIIVTALLAALASTGVGAIIVAIIGVIDALIALICGLAPPDADNTVGIYLCKGISGLLTALVAYLIYDQNDIVSVDDPDRLSPTLDMALGNPALGFTSGADVNVSMTVLNSVELESPDSPLSALYFWQYNDSNARKSTFAYAIDDEKITDEEQQLHTTANLELNQHPTEWTEVDDVYSISRAYSGNVALANAGINQPLNAYSVEGAVTPVQECAMVPNVLTLTPPAVPVCWVRSRDKSTYTNLNLEFDVFPSTLNGFYTLVDKDGGKALGWGQDGELTFPVLRDADGDGLASGLDPDDADADNDDDGVSDFKEVQEGSNPNAADIDQDGLDDSEELHYGTDPLLADSDGDGVTDGDEIAGWSLTYNIEGHTTRTWPDPLLADEDDDGVLDRIEKALGTNPKRESTADALAYEPTLIENDSPLLLLRFDEAANAPAFADSAGRVEGLTAVCSDNRCPASGHLGQIGNAVAFDKVNDVLRLSQPYPALVESRDEFTVAAWIRPTAINTSIQNLFAISQFNGIEQYNLMIVQSRLGFGLNNQFVTAPEVSLVAQEWAHVAVSAEKSGSDTIFNFYINGEFVSTQTNTSTFNNLSATDPILIGSEMVASNPGGGNLDPLTATPNREFGGLMDELVVYDRTLTEAEVEMIRRGRYNLSDGIVSGGDSLTFETTIENQLFGRTAQGLLRTEFPSVINGAQPDSNFTLSRNDGGTANTFNETVDLTVDASPVGGDYEIVQTVGAIIDEPQVGVTSQTANQVFRNENVSFFSGTTDYLNFTSSDYLLSGSDFTLATWVNPDTVSGRRGIMGLEAGESIAYPSLFVDGGRIGFGFGDGANWRYDTTATQWVSANEWTHIAVSYDLSANSAAVYVDGDYKENLTYTTAPVLPLGTFNIGRATNIFRVDFGELEVKCENDNNGPHYDLVYTAGNGSGNLWSQAFVDDVEDTPAPHAANITGPTLFRDYAVVSMCENDSDGSNHATCDSNDDAMGSLVFNAFSADFSINNHTFTTSPGDSSCSFSAGYDDWIEVDYSYDTYALPFDGGIKDTRIIKRVMAGESDVLNLFQSTEILAHFKLNDRPGATSFNDEVAAAVGTCNAAAGRCPLSGVEGRENVAVEFDGTNYIEANEVSRLADEAADSGNEAISFGGWFKPANDFHTVTSAPYLLSFHSSSGNNRILLGLIADETSAGANDAFKVRVFESNNQDNVTTSSFSRGEWHHIFVTIDYKLTTNNAKIYVDGILHHTFTTTSNPSGTGLFTIGQEWDGSSPSQFYKGTADDIIIMRDALPDSAAVLDVMNAAPAYNNRMEYAERYISISNFQQVNNCQPFCKKFLFIDGQASVELDLGVTADVPIPNETTKIEVRVNSFLAGEFTVDEAVTDGTFSWSDFPQPSANNSLDYTVRSINSTDPATQAWFEERHVGTRGQIGDAISFTPDTINSTDSFEVGTAFPAVQPFNDEYTVAVWVKARDLKGEGANPVDVYRPIVGTFNSFSEGRFFFGLKNGQPLVQVETRNQGLEELLAPDEIPANVWTHLAARFGEDDLTLFVNGSEVANLTTFGGFYDNIDSPVVGKGWAYDINSSQVLDVGKFSGEIDELTAYRKGLNDEEIAKLYNFQVAWQDEETIFDLTVDTADPAGQLGQLPDFIAPLGQTVLISTTDDGSTPVLARLVTYVDDGNAPVIFSDVTATRCTDAERNTLFCAPPVEMLPQGSYSIVATAIDAVGNEAVIDGGESFVVDATAPIVVSLPNLPSTPIRPNQSPNDDTLWKIPLTGTVSDFPIVENYLGLGSGVSAGSGVVEVQVVLFDENGLPIGTPVPQLATRNNYNPGGGVTYDYTDWSVDYEIYSDNPTGNYNIQLTLFDAVGNAETYDVGTLRVDATDPGTTVTGYGVPGDSARSGGVLPYFLNAQTALEGTFDEQPDSAETQDQVAGIDTVEIAIRERYDAQTVAAPLPSSVELFLPLDRSQSLENVADSSFSDIANGRTATCSGSTCPQSGISGVNGQALDFDGSDDFLEVSPTTGLTGFTNDFTVAAWIKPAGTGFGRILSTDRQNFTGGYGLTQNGTGLWFTTYGVKDYVSSSGHLTPGIWQHVAVYLNSSNNAEFYVNGVLVDTVSHTAPGVANANTRVLIGATTNTGVNGTTIQHFAGAIDGATVSAGKLTGRDWDAIFGMQPTMHLPFDESNVADGTFLEDVSELGAAATYDRLNANDVTNHSVTGIVGAAALELTPNSSGLAVTARPGTIPFGDESFTIAFWFRNMFDSELVYGSNKVTFSDDNLVHTVNGASHSVPIGRDTGWRPFAFVYDSSSQKLTTYVNGFAFDESTISGGLGLAASETGLSFTHMSSSETTALDDLRVYMRPLPSSEVQALAETGWQAASVTSRGSAENGTWTGGAPDDVEGFYDLFVRGSDVAGNVDEEPQPAWSGIVDTKVPQMIITEIPQGGGAFLYDVLVLDFAIDEYSIALPAACTNESTVLRETNQSPWVLALSEQLPGQLELVTALNINCDATAQLPANAVFSSCDVAGNCVSQNPDGTVVPTAVGLMDVGTVSATVNLVLMLTVTSVLTMLAAAYAARRRS